jgi:hypothetical protein
MRICRGFFATLKKPLILRCAQYFFATDYTDAFAM